MKMTELINDIEKVYFDYFEERTSSEYRLNEDERLKLRLEVFNIIHWAFPAEGTFEDVNYKK